MTETVNDYTPGRSLLVEMTELKEQMGALKAAMLQLVNLQREVNQKLDSSLSMSIHDSDGVSQGEAALVDN